MKAYQSTLFFLALLVIVTLLSHGTRALVATQEGDCKPCFVVLSMEESKNGKYSLECLNESFVVIQQNNLVNLEACHQAFASLESNRGCWCRMY